MKRTLSLALFFATLFLSQFIFAQSEDPNAKPWTRWWWLGSIVTEEGITHSLEDLSKAGFGGVEIVPIYGVMGEEEKEIPYLSELWLQMLDHTIQEAHRLNMDVDISIGSGWPIGGPQVNPEIAAKKFEIESFQSTTKPDLEQIKKSDSAIVWVKAIMNENNSKEVPQDGNLNSPQPTWDVFLIKSSLTGQKVKRAAPGGAGLVMDHFNEAALQQFLVKFDSIFSERDPKPRSFFNDSYEVYGANWTDEFLEEFEKRRGYDFRDYYELLLGEESDLKKRVYMDYQQTIADLLLEEFVTPLHKWTNQMGISLSNQAHGSPGNLLDLYAAADLPQTEAFGTSRFDIPLVRNDPDFDESRFGKPEPLTYKFASSAANLTGKKRSGSESFTWLADHFKIALSMIKPQVDELLVNGINHIFYHGLPYSPYEEGFPGWQFYAAVNFGPQAGFWNQIPLLNRYIYNSQLILQNTLPDQDVLLYFPIDDIWANSGNSTGIVQLDVHHAERWLLNTSVGHLAEELMNSGYQFDYISDRLLDNLTIAKDGSIQSGKANYKAIVIPEVEFIPLSTLQQLELLSQKGAKIIFKNQLPSSTAGLFDFEEKNKKLKVINQKLKTSSNVKISPSISEELKNWRIQSEEFSEKGLSFLRKKDEAGNPIYFVTNLKNEFHSDSITLSIPAKSIELYDPNSGKEGLINFSSTKSGSTKIFLQLESGQSIFIKSYSYEKRKGKKWDYIIPEGNPESIQEPWKLSFLPRYSPLPESTTLSVLKSWTELADEKAKYFGGTGVYTTSFDLPANWNEKESFLLKLGDVRESADVYINGKLIGNAWSVPFDMVIPEGLLHKSGNELRIEVTNLAINQIIAIDQKGEKDWKKFKDANIVNINYKPFDASEYPTALSGLLGPVQLFRLKN